MTFLLLTLGLAACSSTAEPDPTTTTVPEPAVVVAANEYNFVPASLTLGETTMIELRNEGGLAHTWSVLAEPITAEIDLATATRLAEASTEVGQSDRVDVSGLPSGTYQVVCAIPGHFSAGMVGELLVP